jgi:hypothetical protein
MTSSIYCSVYLSVQAKKQNKKLVRVSVTVSLQGIKMTEVSSGDSLLEVSIYRQVYCTVLVIVKGYKEKNQGSTPTSTPTNF